MVDRRDRQKKKFIETLEAQGPVLHACKAAGISRQTAYRWREEDPDFADQWDEALENAVDLVESTIFQQALWRKHLAAIFYLKAHRPKYRDRLSVNVEQVQGEIDELIERMRVNPGFLAARPILDITE